MTTDSMEYIIAVSKAAPKKEPDLTDEDFFRDLCGLEIEYLFDAAKLSKLNRLLISLHVKGFSDKEIESRLSEYLPVLSTKKKLNASAIKERRHYIIRKLNKRFGTDIGLITAMHDAFLI